MNVTASGMETPEGVTFPGGYKKDEPGLVFDIFKASNNTRYPIPGPPLYKSKVAVTIWNLNHDGG
jgi:cellulase